MKTLIIGCSVFLDKDSYKRHLSSIPNNITHLTLDGKYLDFDYPTILSNDGTREIAKSFNNVRLIDVPNKIEIEKRQVYFDLFNPDVYKFLLVLDSDEYCIGDWNKFIKELDDIYDMIYEKDIPKCIGIYVNSSIHDKYDLRPRLWINANNVYMGGKHFEFKSKLDNKPIKVELEINSMKIGHDNRLRYGSYIERRDRYQRVLVQKEGS